MLLPGELSKVIFKATGYSDVGFTMDIYSHIIKGMGKMLYSNRTEHCQKLISNILAVN
jgi:hypothetical protein